MRPLAGSFLRLALQLLVRFQTWLLDGLAARSAALSVPAAEGGDAGKAASIWAQGAKAEQLCSVRADVEKIVDWLNDDYTQQMQRLLSFASQEVHKFPDSLSVPDVSLIRTLVLCPELFQYIPHSAARIQHAGKGRKSCTCPCRP